MPKVSNAELLVRAQEDGLGNTVEKADLNKIDDPGLSTLIEDCQTLLDEIRTYLEDNQDHYEDDEDEEPSDDE